MKRYLRGGNAALVQVRPEARALDDAQRGRAEALFDEVAEGNAVVVLRELGREGVQACVRTVQRAVADRRRRETPHPWGAVFGDEILAAAEYLSRTPLDPTRQNKSRVRPPNR